MTGQAPPATAVLEIDADAAAPDGALSGEFGRLEFSGWAEFAAAIEQWRARIRGDEQHKELTHNDGAP